MGSPELYESLNFISLCGNELVERSIPITFYITLWHIFTLCHSFFLPQVKGKYILSRETDECTSCNKSCKATKEKIRKSGPYKLSAICPQSAFTCSKLTIETIAKGVKYVQS